MLKVWYLYHNSIELGRLEKLKSDQPWFICQFYPNSEFEGHSSFFADFEKKYLSGDIQNYDDFFSSLVVNGYKLKIENKESERFIILTKNKDQNIVSLRATY